MNRSKIHYTKIHRDCLIQLEMFLTGKCAHKWHDFGKLVMLHFMPSKLASKIHRCFSKHHIESIWKKDTFEMFLDWECARFTKADKPLSAVETAQKYYPQYVDKMKVYYEMYKDRLDSFSI